MCWKGDNGDKPVELGVPDVQTNSYLACITSIIDIRWMGNGTPAPVEKGGLSWFIMVYPITYRVSTIPLVMQDFATTIEWIPAGARKARRRLGPWS